MHVCPLGQVMVGLHVTQNQLVHLWVAPALLAGHLVLKFRLKMSVFL